MYNGIRMKAIKSLREKILIANLCIGLILLLSTTTSISTNAAELETLTIDSQPKSIALSTDSNDSTAAAEIFFETAKLPTNAKLISAELSYTQAQASDGFIRILDKAANEIVDSKTLDTTGVITTSRIQPILALWIAKPTTNLGLLFQANEMPESSTVTLSNLKLSLTYSIPDTKAPKLNKLSVKDITATQATISWEANEPVIGFVTFGKTSNYSSSSRSTVAYKENNQLILQDLSPGTTYHFQLILEDPAENKITTTDNTFTTTINNAQDVLGTEIFENSEIAPPRVLQLEQGLDEQAGSAYVTIAWFASETEDIDGYILFRSVDNTHAFVEYQRVPSGTTFFTDSNVDPKQVYNYFVRAYKHDQVSPKSPQEGIFIEDNGRGSTLGLADFRDHDTVDVALFSTAIIGSAIFLIFLLYRSLKKIAYKVKVNANSHKGLENVLYDPDFYLRDDN